MMYAVSGTMSWPICGTVSCCSNLCWCGLRDGTAPLGKRWKLAEGLAATGGVCKRVAVVFSCALQMGNETNHFQGQE